MWIPVLIAVILLAGVWALPAVVLPQSNASHEEHGASDSGEPVATRLAHRTDAAGRSDAEHAAHQEHPELPNLIGLIYRAAGGAEGSAPAWLGVLDHFQDIFFALLSAGTIILLVRLGMRRMRLRPGRGQVAIEAVFGGFRDFVVGILGPGGARYVPFLGTLFLYIWFMNIFGLVPLMKSPTSVLSTTAALAICVFCYVQWTGIRRLGPLNYLRHLAGDPRDLIGWALVPLMLPLHIISEFAKPVSLALRLFGNILGEDVLLGVFAGLGVAALAFLGLPIGLPLHLPFILLALLMSTVQALVFTLLSTIYIMQVLPHDEEHATSVAAPAAAIVAEGASPP